ncbi:MAG: response regulator [Candidatus Thermochlorobacter sp.]
MILLVDDNTELLTSLSEFLSAYYPVKTFTNPEDSLAFAMTNRGLIEVSVVDYVMPEMSGDVLARELKEVDPNMLVILMSGYVDFERVEPLLRERLIYQFFTKPVDFERLLRSVDTAVKLYLKKQAL